MRRRSRLRTEIEFLLARFVLWSLSRGSVSCALRIARFYVGMLELALPRLRRVARRNLAMALPQSSEAERERIAGSSFASIARLLVSLARFDRFTRENIGEWIVYDGLEHFHEAKRRGKGILFATAHLGNWEISAFAHGLMTESMHVVVRALDNPKIDALLTRLRTMSGNRVIEKRDFARGILRALAGNEAVGVLIDQNASLAEGIFVDFFGVLACVGTGFAKIAAHSGAAIIPGFALWNEEERRYRLKFYPPLYATGDVEADTRRIHALLEAVIREHSGQWLWMHRRWKTRPPGEPALY